MVLDPTLRRDYLLRDFFAVLDCCEDFIGGLFGRQGKNVHEIATQTGCRVSVMQDREVCPGKWIRRIYVSGTLLGLSAGVDKILETLGNRCTVVVLPWNVGS